MAVSVGARLGPYEILARIGAGGMGEVWRARDTRLDRVVAIKVLPAELDSDPERLKRFEREARAASSLSHPNIVTVYEVARLDTASFIVMELVEGMTLRDRIAGSPLRPREILAIAPQIAAGLARAHASGIVHRDLKPENVMVTKDGLVKILDFGLVKLTRPEQESGRTQATVSQATRPGIAMGTVSYMSPEQALGHDLDFRSDQFALGSILYEMATGHPAFRRESAPQTLTAIIEDDPEPIGQTAPRTPAPLRWLIHRCLSKEPKGRYASTEDLARELADLRDHVSELSSGATISIEEPRLRPRWRTIAIAIAGLAALAGMFVLGDRARLAKTSSPRFRQLTFRGTGIGTARFAPDGQTIVFSSQTEGKPPELFSMRLDSPETRSLGLPPAQIMSISSLGQMAILLAPPFALGPRAGHLLWQLSDRDPFLLAGTLAEAPLGGGAAREILEDVSFADWDPNGKGLAVVHRSGNRNRLEFPIGTAVFEAERGLLNHPRVSTRRHELAFKDWADLFMKDAGEVVRPIQARGTNVEIAWSEMTGEIWSTVGPGSGLQGETQLWAATPRALNRLVASLPADFVLYDIAANGRVLLGRLTQTSEILGTFPSEPRERNLSYFDTSEAVSLSGTGHYLLFGDLTVFQPGFYYLSETAGSQPKHLRDDCAPEALSPDGRFFLCFNNETGFSVVPTGSGPTQKLDAPGALAQVVDANQAKFFPDGKRVLFVGGEPRRIWVQDLEGGRKPQAITPEEVRRPVVVGDGRFICAHAADGGWYLYPVDEKDEPRRVVGLQPGEEPIQSSPDGLLYVRGADELRPGETLMVTRVYRLDPLTGRRELWKEIPPKDPRTGGAISTILFSADGKTCVWTHIRYSTELVLAEGLK